MKNGAMRQSHLVIYKVIGRDKGIAGGHRSHGVDNWWAFHCVQGITIEPILFPAIVDPVIVSNPFSLVVVSNGVLGLRRNHVEFIEKVPSALISGQL